MSSSRAEGNPAITESGGSALEEQDRCGEVSASARLREIVVAASAALRAAGPRVAASRVGEKPCAATIEAERCLQATSACPHPAQRDEEARYRQRR